jgi:hypothetical protein
MANLLKPISDFGFGRTSLWEGGVGMFIFAGLGTTVVIKGELVGQTSTLPALIPLLLQGFLWFSSAGREGDN